MSKNTKQPGFLAAFFGFRRMVSPAFITLFYYLGLIGILAGTAYALMGSGPVYDQLVQSGLGASGSVGLYAGAAIFALISILLLRFFCELLIALFTISNRLSDVLAILDTPKVAEPIAAPTPMATPEAEAQTAPEPQPQEPEASPATESQADRDTEEEAVAETEEEAKSSPAPEPEAKNADGDQDHKETETKAQKADSPPNDQE